MKLSEVSPLDTFLIRVSRMTSIEPVQALMSRQYILRPVQTVSEFNVLGGEVAAQLETFTNDPFCLEWTVLLLNKKGLTN